MRAGGGPALIQPSQTDVVYGTADGQKLLLDVYQPPGAGPHPGVMLIHGGGWRSGDKGGERVTGGLLSKAGFACFSVNYRLAPKHPHPAQVQDCARAVRWIRARAAEYGVDPERIGALGQSAGGHLSLMLGTIKPDDYQTDDDPNKGLSAKVQCVVDYFGPADFTEKGSWQPHAEPILRGFLGAPRAQAPDKWADASPVCHVTKGAAPTLIIQGDADRLVLPAQSQAMKATLDKAGVECELIMVSGGGHGLLNGDKQQILQAQLRAVEFLRTHLKAGQ
jgi:acetyl esterase/lipase